jgi:hypothetical protein
MLGLNVKIVLIKMEDKKLGLQFLVLAKLIFLLILLLNFSMIIHNSNLQTRVLKKKLKIKNILYVFDGIYKYIV